MKNQVTADGMTGFDDLGEGRPVVLLHAFPLARAMWRPQVEALRHSYRVITPDLRGFHDARGWLCELFRHDELPAEFHPVMAYISETEPGVARGAGS